MLKKFTAIALSLGAALPLHAQEAPAPVPAAPQESPAPVAQQSAPPAGTQAAASNEPKALAGMSILGNQEAPKSLVIVPWKSSEIGNGIGVSRALDTRIRAVDKDVFMRELKYYAIRAGAEK